jgi:hypothetical protein
LPTQVHDRYGGARHEQQQRQHECSAYPDPSIAHGLPPASAFGVGSCGSSAFAAELPKSPDDPRVLTQPDGTLWNPETFTKAFIRLIGNAAVPKVRFHDLRHTHATHLLAENIHPKIVSEPLGHATIAIMLDTYSHVLPEMQEDAARRVDAALSTALGPV